MPIKRISFTCDGDTLVGNLHLPDGTGPFPGTVVAGPMTSVKEQVTGTYATALARRGIATLAIDHRHYGESGGQPRQYEVYTHKIRDLNAAFEALAADPEIDPTRLAATGVCLGCGYVAHTLGHRADIRAFAAVAGYYRDPAAMRAADPDGFDAKVAEGIAAREHYATTGEVLTIPAVALDRDAAMTIRSTYDYYADRAKVPNYVNGFAIMSREHFLPFDVQSAAPNITMPFLMAHGPNALNPGWANQFFDRVPGEKTRIDIASKDQTEIYDNPDIVDPVAAQIAAFFRDQT